MNDNAKFYGDNYQKGQRNKPYLFGKEIIPFLIKHFIINSIIDIGCGNGGFLMAATEIGIPDITGVDGSYIKDLMIPKKQFISYDLRTPLRLYRKFDLVVSFEVAEHIEEKYAYTFIDTLIRLGDTILFSAAKVGQGGVNHVNCQPSEYWEEIFYTFGFIKVPDINIQNILKDKEHINNLWQTKNSIVYKGKLND